MIEDDFADGEIKKKKRRVLFGLFFILVGTAAVLPLAKPYFTPAAASEAVEETLLPVPTNSPEPSQAGTTTPSGSPPDTPSPLPPTATAVPVQETLSAADGAGGGDVDVTPPVDGASVEEPTATLAVPAQLPVTGADGMWGLAWLGLGFSAWLVGIILLRAGLKLGGARPERR